MATNRFSPLDYITVTTNRVAAVPIVHVAGELDLATVRVLADPIHSELANHPPGLVIDLQDVQFIGSAGLNVLVDANNQAERAHSDLRLVANHQAVLRPLEITGLTDLFQLSTSVSDAVVAVTVVDSVS